MKTQLIMFDTPIIVSDESPKAGDYAITYPDFDVIQLNQSTWVMYDEKIIAGIEGLPKIDWNGLGEEFGWIDVEKLNKEAYIKHSVNDDRLTLDEQIQRTGGFNVGFKEGFKKAQSLNEKKFSLEDMKKAMFKVYKNGIRSPKEGKQSFNEILNEIIKSLQQPKVFDIEVEVEYGWDSSGGKHSRPKITNNSIKILRKL